MDRADIFALTAGLILALDFALIALYFCDHKPELTLDFDTDDEVNRKDNDNNNTTMTIIIQ